MKPIFFQQSLQRCNESVEKGKHILKMLNIKPWENVGFVAFPNIDNREALREAGLDITEDELKV